MYGRSGFFEAKRCHMRTVSERNDFLKKYRKDALVHAGSQFTDRTFGRASWTGKRFDSL
jgi:hypothetical protein